jgi:hypothetical protein
MCAETWHALDHGTLTGVNRLALGYGVAHAVPALAGQYVEAEGEDAESACYMRHKSRVKKPDLFG